MSSERSFPKRDILSSAIAAAGLAVALGAAVSVSSFSGQIGAGRQRHESVVINIEVPVRVLKRDAFVDGPGLKDLEVYEDGVLQPLEGGLLISSSPALRLGRDRGSRSRR